jgi:hypothetical protein
MVYSINANIGYFNNSYKVLVGKREGMRLLGRPRTKWVNNIQLMLNYRTGVSGLDSSECG